MLRLVMFCCWMMCTVLYSLTWFVWCPTASNERCSIISAAPSPRYEEERERERDRQAQREAQRETQREREREREYRLVCVSLLLCAKRRSWLVLMLTLYPYCNPVLSPRIPSLLPCFVAPKFPPCSFMYPVIPNVPRVFLYVSGSPDGH